MWLTSQAVLSPAAAMPMVPTLRAAGLVSHLQLMSLDNRMARDDNGQWLSYQDATLTDTKGPGPALCSFPRIADIVPRSIPAVHTPKNWNESD